MVNGFQALVYTDTLSIPEALKVTAIGLIIVFAVLALLIVCIELLHALLKDRIPAAQNAPKATAAQERISAGVMAEVPDAQDAANDGEFIAAVSAAINATTGKSNESFVIKSIKKG